MIHFIMASRVDERGRIVLPQELRERWNLLAGSLVLIRVNCAAATFEPSTGEHVAALGLRPASRNTLAR
ncbi:AbrB/MazE/SpoVT family DNA-binding domain-containing protein [archaeon]|nr:AbrB/MazE/SpoVT family DNA-binding domain-containing protein [archaeon]